MMDSLRALRRLADGARELRATHEAALRLVSKVGLTLPRLGAAGKLTWPKKSLLDRDVRALAALPDNQHALSASYDKTVKLFNVNDGAVLCTFTHHTRKVTSLALMPNGLRFVSGSDDGTTRVAHHGLAP